MRKEEGQPATAHNTTKILPLQRHQKPQGEGTSRRGGIDRCNKGLGPTKSSRSVRIVRRQYDRETIISPNLTIP
jgi:hypothetical protein